MFLLSEEEEMNSHCLDYIYIRSEQKVDILSRISKLALMKILVIEGT